MAKIILWKRGADQERPDGQIRPAGVVSYMSPCSPAPWGRLVKSVLRDGGRVVFDPPVRLDNLAHSSERMAALEPEFAETEEDYINRMIARYCSNAVEVRIIDESELPTKEYRDAWTINCAIDMGKAVEIHTKRIRVDRASRLVALDVEYQRADEAADAAAKIKVAARKQRLRDVTSDPRLRNAKTPAELSALTLDVLAPE